MGFKKFYGLSIPVFTYCYYQMLYYICSAYGSCSFFYRIKRESGENPELTRSCKLQ